MHSYAMYRVLWYFKGVKARYIALLRTKEDFYITSVNHSIPFTR